MVKYFVFTVALLLAVPAVAGPCPPETPAALAGQCPADIAAFDAALGRALITRADVAKVIETDADLAKAIELRNLGEQQHNAGDHADSAATLAAAHKLLGGN